MNINKQNIPTSWSIKRLGDILSITSCKRVHESEWTTSGVPFYRARELVALHDKLPIEPLFISEELYEKNTKLSGCIQAGDLLVTGVGTIGIQYLVKPGDRFYFKDGNIIWLKNEDKINGEFLYYSFDGQFIRKQILNAAGIGTVGTYTIDNAKKTYVMVPPIEEQEKIAEILGTWDRAIEELSDLITEKKELKRSLMQRLLTGTQRLPGFYDDWEHEMLGNMVNVSSAGSKSQYIEESGRYLIVDMGAVSNEARIIAKKQTNYTYDFLSCGDIVMPKDDIGGGNIIGKTVVIDADNKYILGDHVFKLRIKNTYEAKFISNLINSFLVNKYMRRMATGSAQLGLAKRDVEKCVLWLPVDPAEQKAIADVLSKADAEIDLLNQQLGVLKEQKRGLMQKLLTGEVRVKVDVE